MSSSRKKSLQKSFDRMHSLVGHGNEVGILYFYFCRIFDKVFYEILVEKIAKIGLHQRIKIVWTFVSMNQHQQFSVKWKEMSSIFHESIPGASVFITDQNKSVGWEQPYWTASSGYFCDLEQKKWCCYKEWTQSWAVSTEANH